MSNITKFPRVFILILLIGFATFMGILFTPALPQISRDFGVSESIAQWTMSIFMVGYAIGQLPYGPIANRFGRKKALAIGLALALIGSIMAYLSTSFSMLCLARFIQALGSGVGLKIAFTMIGDLHSGDAATNAISTLTMSFGFMPGISTAIGGFITTDWGWQGCFLFLSIYTVFVWILTLFLPETAHELHRDALKLKKIGHGLANQFKDSYVTLHAFLVGLTTSIPYIFVTLAPYIAINRIGLSTSSFGLWSMIPSLGLFTGAVVSKMLVGKCNPRINMLGGILVVLVSALVFSLCFAISLVNVWTLFIPFHFMNLGAMITWNNASSKGISGAKDKSNASAVIQFINISTATASVFLVEVVPPTTTMLLPAGLGILIIIMFATWLKLKPHHQEE